MPRRPRKETLRSIRKRASQRSRGAGGRFSAGFGKAPHNEILGPIRTRAGRKNPNFRVDWVISDVLAINRNPAVIVDHVSDIVLAIHHDAIKDGMRASGAMSQDPVERGLQRRLADEGKRSESRGILSGGLAENLTRGKISIRGGRLPNGDDATVARCRIFPSAARSAKDARIGGFSPSDFGNQGNYPAFIAAESRRGHEYFDTTGDIERAVDQAIAQILDLAIIDQIRDPDTTEYRAPAAKAM